MRLIRFLSGPVTLCSVFSLAVALAAQDGGLPLAAYGDDSGIYIARDVAAGRDAGSAKRGRLVAQRAGEWLT